MSTSLWSRSLALAGALALGLLGSSFGASGCLIPDYCIAIASNGTDWCTQMHGAQMWPAGEPELAELVLTPEETLPGACACMNDGEVEILLNQDPADHYAGLVMEIEAVARDHCASLVPEGYEHNCLQFVDGDILAPTFDAPVEGGESRECIGSCTYANEPPFGEPCGEPDPWECNDEDPPGTGDTGDDMGGDTSGGADPGGVDPGRELTR